MSARSFKRLLDELDKACDDARRSGTTIFGIMDALYVQLAIIAALAAISESPRATQRLLDISESLKELAKDIKAERPS